MNTLVILLLSLWMVCIVAFLWLVVRAFKTSAGWGIGVLLLSPLLAIIYALKYWDEAKKPFLLYMTTAGAGFAIALYIFVSSGGARLIETNTQFAKETQQGTSIDEKQLAFMENSLALMEKFARSEKDKQLLAVLRKYFHHKKTGFTDEQRSELRQEVLRLLERPDLTQKQRQDLEKMLQELERQEGTAIISNSDSNPQQEKVAVQQEKAAALENQPEAKPKAHSAAPISESKSKPDQKETVQKQGDVAAPKNPPEVDSKPHQVSLEPKPERPLYKTISPAQARNYIGSSVILVGPRGDEQKCVLAGVSGNTLLFERHFTSGVFSFSYKASEIRSLKVYQQ